MLFCRYLINRGFDVLVFSNGMIPVSKLRSIRSVLLEHVNRPNQLRFAINVNELKYRSKGEKQMQTQTFRFLDQITSLSFNIFETCCSFSFLLELIDRFSLIREIRFGIAQPIISKPGSGLDVDHYRDVFLELTKFVDQCIVSGIRGVLDCGYPLCMFDDSSLGKFVRAGIRPNFSCSPCIDIDVNLSVWHCFPLSEISTNDLLVYRGPSELVSNMKKHIRDKKDKQNVYGIFPECTDCKYRKRNLCGGGCAAHYLSESNACLSDVS